MIFKESTLLSGAMILACIIGYCFNPLLVGRVLGPEGIAQLGAYLAIYQILVFPSTPIGFILIKDLILKGQELGAQGIEIFRSKVLRQHFVGMLALVVLVCCVSPLLATVLNLKSSLVIVAASLTSLTAYLYQICRSYLQAMLKFDQLAVSIVFEPLFRLLIGGLAVFAGYLFWGSVAAYFFGFLLAGIYAYFAISANLSERSVTPKGFVQKAENTSSNTLCIWVYSFYLTYAMSIDTLVVKIFYEDFEAGQLIAAMTIVKLFFPVVIGVASVAYSRVCKAIAAGHKANLVLLNSLCVMLLFGAGYFAVCYLFSKPIIELAYGNEFVGSSGLLKWGVLAVLPFGFVSLLANYLIARGAKWLEIGLIVGIFFQVGLMALFQSSLGSLLFLFGVGYVVQVIFIVCVIILNYSARLSTA